MGTHFKTVYEGFLTAVSNFSCQSFHTLFLGLKQCVAGSWGIPDNLTLPRRYEAKTNSRGTNLVLLTWFELAHIRYHTYQLNKKNIEGIDI